MAASPARRRFAVVGAIVLGAVAVGLLALVVVTGDLMPLFAAGAAAAGAVPFVHAVRRS